MHAHIPYAELREINRQVSEDETVAVAAAVPPLEPQPPVSAGEGDGASQAADDATPVAAGGTATDQLLGGTADTGWEDDDEPSAADAASGPSRMPKPPGKKVAGDAVKVAGDAVKVAKAAAEAAKVAAMKFAPVAVTAQRPDQRPLLVIPAPDFSDATYITRQPSPRATSPRSGTIWDDLGRPRSSGMTEPFSPQPPGSARQWNTRATAGLRVAVDLPVSLTGRQEWPSTVPSGVRWIGAADWGFATGDAVRQSVPQGARPRTCTSGATGRSASPRKDGSASTRQFGSRSGSGRMHARRPKTTETHGSVYPLGEYLQRAQQWPPASRPVPPEPLPTGLVSHRWNGVNPGETKAPAWIHRALQPRSPLAMQSTVWA